MASTPRSFAGSVERCGSHASTAHSAGRWMRASPGWCASATTSCPRAISAAHQRTSDESRCSGDDDLHDFLRSRDGSAIDAMPRAGPVQRPRARRGPGTCGGAGVSRIQSGSRSNSWQMRTKVKGGASSSLRDPLHRLARGHALLGDARVVVPQRWRSASSRIASASRISPVSRRVGVHRDLPGVDRRRGEHIAPASPRRPTRSGAVPGSQARTGGRFRMSMALS